MTTHDKVKIIPPISAAFASTVAVLVLIGWIFNLETLKRIAPGFVAMNPMTAVAFIFTGLSLWLWRSGLDGKNISVHRQKLAKSAALLVASIGFCKLTGVLLGTQWGIDQLLFAEKLAPIDGGLPNRMAPNTALNFIFLGSSLLIFDQQTSLGEKCSQALAWIAGLISLLAIIGYAYGASSFYGIGVFIPMALHTATVFFTLSIGILCLRPEYGLMGIMTSEEAGGHISRRILPATILILFVLGWLRLEGQRAGFYQTEVGVALLVAGGMAVSALLVLRVAAPLNRLDAERKQAEIQIRKLNEDLKRRAHELEASNKELEAFSYSVSHDLRAPLRHIGGFIDLLTDRSEGKLDEKSLRYLGIISDSAKEMSALINDLLTFSRLVRAEMHESPVYLDELIDHVKCNHLPATTQPVEWMIATELPVIKGDRSLLRQVFVNLLSNALKYSSTRNPAKIEIGMQKNVSDEVVIFIRDNGVGFDMQYAQKLFGVFQRLHSAEQFEGTGIGLANVKRIIERHGGRVWAEAKVNEGATFYVGFPKSSEVIAEKVIPFSEAVKIEPESVETEHEEFEPAINRIEQPKEVAL